MLLTSLFVITLVGLGLSGLAAALGLYNVKNNADLMKQYAAMTQVATAHQEAMLEMATAMEVLNAHQSSNDDNIQALSKGLNALVKAKSNDNIMTMLASIPSELLPQA